MNQINQVVIQKIKAWLSENHKSIQWLADEIGVSKSLMGHILTGERALLPKRIVQIARIMGTTVEELVAANQSEKPEYEGVLRGTVQSSVAKRHMSYLLFAIEDCVHMRWQLSVRRTER